MTVKLVFSTDILQPMAGWHIDREQKIQNEQADESLVINIHPKRSKSLSMILYGRTFQSLVPATTTEQSTSGPATAACIEQNKEKGSSIKPLALIADIDQTTSDPTTAEFIEQGKTKILSSSPSVFNDTEEQTSDFNTAEYTQQDDWKEEISEQATSDPATAEYKQQYKRKRVLVQTTSECGNAEGIQLEITKKSYVSTNITMHRKK